MKRFFRTTVECLRNNEVLYNYHSALAAANNDDNEIYLTIAEVPQFEPVFAKVYHLNYS